jgi:hypothetical protein
MVGQRATLRLKFVLLFWVAFCDHSLANFASEKSGKLQSLVLGGKKMG